MGRYKNSYKVTVNLEPWFSSSFGFTMLHMFEELGGSLARGEMVLIHDGSEKAIKLYDEENTGTLTVEREGGFIYTIPIFIYKKELDWVQNYVRLNFYCFKDKSFITEFNTSDWTDIGGAMKALFPGKVDLRCDTDIQGDNIKYFQSGETNYAFLLDLCYGYKKNSVFSFGWEGLMIKETMGKSNSYGDTEGALEIHGDSQLTQIDDISTTYQPELYTQPKNPWVDNYESLQSENLRITKINNNFSYISKDYFTLSENRNYNRNYMRSDLFRSFRVVTQDMPKYKIGDVLFYKRDSEDAPNAKKYPFNYYLVRSNELFLSVNGSEYVDEDRRNMSWTSSLIGLELGEDGKAKIAIGTEQNPVK